MRETLDSSAARDSSGDVPWAFALERVLADCGQPRLVFQPIVDLQRGVVAGYEALSRFSGPPDAPPYVWFEEAERLGRSVELELRAVRQALRTRATLPPDTFLTINMTPEALLHPDARGVLSETQGLERLVFEVTEHARVADYRALRRAVDRVREAGGMVAVDDAGAGYASLKHVLELRPDFVKLDRELIAGVDQDPIKRSVVQMLGELSDRIDAWIVAEGIEEHGELDAMVEMGVPLGQGWLLGRPSAPWATLGDPLCGRIQARHREIENPQQLAALLERRRVFPHDATLEDVARWFSQTPLVSAVVQIDPDKRPLGLLRRADIEGGRLRRHPVLAVAPTADIAEVARRAMARVVDRRFDPVVCRNPSGVYVGLVSIERLVEQLSRS